MDRYPPAVDARQSPTRDVPASHHDVLTLRSHEVFDIDLVTHGESYDTIRSWCHQTLARFFVAPRPVVFDGYIAHLTRA